MADTPEISVVIPLYNKASYIARALNSVLSQTFQDFEIILIDDGSTDDGAIIVKNLNDPRIRLIQQVNQGVSAARNRGIMESSAELIAFLDADDEWMPYFLETIKRLRDLYPKAGIYGTGYEVHFPGKIVQKKYREYEGERCLTSYFGAQTEFGSATFNSSSFAAPRGVLLKMGGFPSKVRWNEDGTLWGMIALQYPIAYSPTICSIYHQYSANNSIRNREYLNNPFVDFISTIPGDILKRREDFHDLAEYCELSTLSCISRNIYNGHGPKARIELASVKSSRFAWKKLKLRLMSFIPQFGWHFIHDNEKMISYFKWKIIHK